MATITKRRRRNGTIAFRAQIRMKGRPAVSATFARLTDARAWCAATEAAIREGRYFSDAEARRHSLAEAIARYERDILPRKRGTWSEGQRQQLEFWKARLGSLCLADVTPAAITEARDALAASPVRQGKTVKPRSAGSVNRHLAVLSHLFTVACNDWGWLEYNPMRKVSRLREPRGRVRFLDDAEREALLRECRASKNTMLHDVVLLAITTGMRRAEILGLAWDNVDFGRRLVLVEHSKNDERRSVPLVGAAFDALLERSRIRRLDSPLVFPGRRRRGGARPAHIQNAWKAALKRAGIDDFRFHDLRHTAASYLAMSGATLPEIAAILGHRTLQMVQRYAHLSESHLSGVVERMVQTRLTPAKDTSDELLQTQNQV
ncbi:MAG: tyrosine-type recombinase/integrase [Candidatus Hydrogenedentales bacterium]